jgi:hypothetical protein
MQCGDCGRHPVLLVDGVICEPCLMIREEQDRNYTSHHIGVVDDCLRCLYCEVAIWRSHLSFCNG